VKFILPEILSNFAGEKLTEDKLEGRSLPKSYYARPDQPLKLAFLEKAVPSHRATVFYIADANQIDFDNADPDLDEFPMNDYLPESDEHVTITLLSNSIALEGRDLPRSPYNSSVMPAHTQYYLIKVEEANEAEGLLLYFRYCEKKDGVSFRDSSVMEAISIPDLTPELENYIIQGMKIAEYASTLDVTDSIKQGKIYTEEALSRERGTDSLFLDYIVKGLTPSEFIPDIYKSFSSPNARPDIEGIYESVSFFFVDDELTFKFIDTDGEEGSMEDEFALLKNELTRYAYKERYQKGVMSGQVISKQPKEKLVIRDLP